MSFDMSPSFTGYIITFWHKAMFQGCLYLLFPISGDSSGIPLSGEWHLVATVQTFDVFITMGLSLLPDCG